MVRPARNQKIRAKLTVMVRRVVVVISLLLTQACATYQQTNRDFTFEFERGQLQDALETLRNSPLRNSRNEFLYFVNGGLVLSMMGRYDESNEYLEKAYVLGEDFRINYFLEAAAYLTNPMVTEYRGEDHEHLMLLYYKAINFLKQGRTEEALVECRRLNIRLQQLSDRYENPDRYREDAFVHLLMGIIYEMDRDYNNAFIAYRNAYTIYTGSFARLFRFQVPNQLKEDLLRTATLSGLTDELDRLKTEFDMPAYHYVPTENGQLIFFWHNGLSPVKAEWGINFAADVRGQRAFFSNDEMHFAFDFPIGNYSQEEQNALKSLRVFRVAFPRFVERPEFFQSGGLIWNGRETELHVCQNIHQIATHCLQQRMTFEFSKALIRVALKKALEQQVRKSDRILGSVVGVVNALTERADVRSWQTLPHNIHFARLSLPPGRHEVQLVLHGQRLDQKHEFTYEVKKGETLFHTFSSLETNSPRYY